MIDDIVKEIEAGFVYADLMLASTPRTMLSRMEDNEILNEAAALLALHHSPVYLSRARELFAVEQEDGYSNPFDRAIAAYAYLLGHIADAEAHAFLRELATASCRSDLRFTRSVAQYVLEQAATANNTATVSDDTENIDSYDWGAKKVSEQPATKRLPEEAAFLVFARLPKMHQPLVSRLFYNG